MIYTYDELLIQKDNGKKLNFEDITKLQLEKLVIDERKSNSQIAQLYDVSDYTVREKRREWDLMVYSPKYVYNMYERHNENLFEHLNNSSKSRLSGEENIDWISKALTHYLFRNGPVEDMHANKQLSQEDMKILNKYMVNRIAGLLKLINDDEWLKIELMLLTTREFGYGREWDKAEYDLDEINQIYEYETNME